MLPLLHDIRSILNLLPVLDFLLIKVPHSHLQQHVANQQIVFNIAFYYDRAMCVSVKRGWAVLL